MPTDGADLGHTVVVLPTGTVTDVWIIYAAGEAGTERRHIRMGNIVHGTPPGGHEPPQWLLRARDLDRGGRRTFALARIRAWAATAEGLPAIEEAARG